MNLEGDCLEFSLKMTTGVSSLDSSLIAEDLVSEWNIKVWLFEGDTDDGVLIAKGRMFQFQLDLASREGLDIFDLSDVTSQTLELAGEAFSFSDEDYLSKMKACFEDTLIFYPDVMILDRLEILPEFRGKGLARKIILRLIQKFYGTVGFWVIKAFPLQMESGDSRSMSEWRKKMRYDLLNCSKASQSKLIKIYKEMGFINPYKESILFATSDMVMERLEGHEEIEPEAL